MNNLFSLKDKVAIVTGSKGTIGHTISKCLKEYETIVYEFDIKNSIEEDVTNYSSFFSFFHKIYDDNKKIDILINNAGITCDNWNNHSETRFNKTIDVNLKAPYFLSKMVYEYMKTNKQGSIINITSLWSEIGFTGNPAYGASKGGLKQLTKALACEFAESNVRVNNIGLGYFKTDMTRKSWNNKKRRNLITERTLLKRWGKSEDIIGAIIYLCSDASSYVTGQDFYIDGGWLANGGL